MSDNEYTEWDLVKYFLAGIVFMFWIWALFISDADLKASHRALGSKSHACFANHTCRENLRCIVADGLDEPGVCVR